MKNFSISLRLTLWFTLLTGVAYPLLVTVIGGRIYRDQAQGSLIYKGNRVVGSRLIAQAFKDPAYFWPRPSAIDYNPMPSGGSNLSVTHSNFQKADHDRRAALIVSDPPPDFISASGSGLDPHISPEAALLQVDRVAKARKGSGATPAQIRALAESYAEPPTFGILGEPRVNVLLLNLELDRRYPRTP
jgi:K+-transporting ATPase ATPase C chain